MPSALLAWVTLVTLGSGYQLNSFEPTPAAERFMAVRSPWYDSERLLGVSLTLEDAFSEVSATTAGASSQYLVKEQRVGHLDIAGAALGRLQLSLTLPVSSLSVNSGTITSSLSSSVTVGDLRVGAAVQVWGDATKQPLSVHLAGDFWIPVGAEAALAGDADPRGVGRVIVAGILNPHVRYAANLGYLFRTPAALEPPLNIFTTGDELQLQAAFAFGAADGRWSVGPEATLRLQADGSRQFSGAGTGVEAFVTGGYQFIPAFRMGAGVGLGLARTSDVPVVRGVFRLTYEFHAAPPPVPVPKAPPVAPEPPAPPELPPPPVMPAADSNALNGNALNSNAAATLPANGNVPSANTLNANTVATLPANGNALNSNALNSNAAAPIVANSNAPAPVITNPNANALNANTANSNTTPALVAPAAPKALPTETIPKAQSGAPMMLPVKLPKDCAEPTLPAGAQRLGIFDFKAAPRGELKKLGAWLKAHPKVHVDVVEHMEAGVPEVLQKSTVNAKGVMKLLMRAGARADQLTAHAAGSAELRCKGKVLKNVERRVEIIAHEK